MVAFSVEERSLIGQTLSHYRIVAPLGAGGMGEVYRATDIHLDREVAIKVLPPEVADDAERLARFKREALLLAALNHPNIAAIYGLEEADGRPFLVLELVEGEDLKERLARGAIPVDEALEIAKQIAEAIEGAHERGIIHRDLKPANIKLTPDGRVKVLDFGLAKAWEGDASDGRPSPAGVSQLPTLASSGTVAGLILGTAAYMSPEQARGKPVDRRTDVWSFGVLLWEMLTGRALFSGDTLSDVIASVLKEEPDLDALPKETPAPVRWLMARCLRRDPRTRFPDIGAVRLELQEVLSGTATEPGAGRVVAETRTEHHRRTRERAAWATLALLLAGLLGILIVHRSTDTPGPRPASHFVLDTPAELDFGDTNGLRFSPPAVSPDGRSIVFAAQKPPGGTSFLWIRSLGSPEVHALAGTQGALQPFWSPDGESIGFVAQSELRTLDLRDERVETLCELLGIRLWGATWSRDGTIVFSAGFAGSELISVSSAGGQERSLASPDASRGELGYVAPQFLPDGRHFLFGVRSDDPMVAGLYVTSLDAPADKRRILPETGRAVYAEPGYLLYAREGRLLARPFDPKRRVTTGAAVPIASDVAESILFADEGSFSASASGVVTWTSALSDEVRLEWLDRNGTSLGTLGEVGRYGQIALSPDDRRVAVEVRDDQGSYDIWAIDVARGVASRLTSDPGDERDPVWAPNSQELIFTASRSGSADLVRLELTGSQVPSPLPNGVGADPEARDIAEGWLRGGNTILYLTFVGERVVWMASLDEGGPPEPLVANRSQLDEPQVSADERWLAYISSESGRREVYVEPFRRSGETVRVSPDGGGQPRWRRDGKELFYLALDGRLMAVDVREGPSGPEVGIPRVLVPARKLRAIVQGPDYDDYAVTADGQRFLVKRLLDADARQRIHVLLDWPSLVE